MFLTDTLDTVTLVKVEEELDARNAQQAKDFFKGLVNDGHEQVVVDLSGLTFVDSSGLGALVTGLKAARQVNGDVRLCSLTGPVKSIFELTRLFRVFEIFEDREQAITSFR